GGEALEVKRFLEQEKGRAETNRLLREIPSICAEIPQALESRFGRLGELGVDLGIDRDNNVWILEVNSKPGRRVFSLIHNLDAERRAVRNPIQYACFLLKGV
ncbi:MAG TPA: YheC/YheD family protein, partial [Bacilli bacterium]